MILCDIGNTHFHFSNKGRLFDEVSCSIKKEKIYFISVNNKFTKQLLKKNPKSIDLSKHTKFDTPYEGLGIDRIMACKTIENGIVVDAGSAITIDIMHNNLHLGGYILPGMTTLNESYENISKKLKYNFNTSLDSNIIPTNTKEAISYGAIGMILTMIAKVAKNSKIYFTGGDGVYLSRYFKNSIFIKDLIFRGMKKTIEEMK